MQELTVVVTTSPTPSNPSLSLIEYVLSSFACVPGLSACKKIIVCDGCKLLDPAPLQGNFSGSAPPESLWKAGRVTPEALDSYRQYIETLQTRVANAGQLAGGEQSPDEELDPFANAEVMVLEDRHGFGFAIKRALERVPTRYVMVVQHDRNFQRPCDIPALLQSMSERSEAIKYVCLASASLLDYAHRTKSRFRVDVGQWECRLRNGDRLLPMVCLLDSTHVAEAEWYRGFVFDPALRLVKKGDFIEDRLGQLQVAQVREQGFPQGWLPFRTWVYCEPQGSSVGYVAHVNGRSIREGASRSVGEVIAKLRKGPLLWAGR
mmetsp:Transcript_22019/g.61119  ORF Transcript_22019/g.61119 Transcript_22019/m.61119 type:complete len:320 (-) Transcript_22019:369-1328(-)